MKRGKIESIIPKKDEVEINQVLNNIRNTCPFCEKRFDNAKKVENYVMCIENRINAINCKRTCHTVRALKEHKMIHRSDYFFECNICHVKYKSEDSLKKHDIEKLHSNYEYICEYCSCSYKLKTDLTHHMKRLLFRVTNLSILQEGSKECEDTRVETPKT